MLKLRGFTILELLLALAIGTILLFCVAPSWRSMMNRSHAKAYSTQLVTALQLARIMAIKSGTTTLFCKSRDGKSCGGEWRDGQILLDAKSKVLRIFSGVPRGDQLVWHGDLGSQESIAFLPTGFSNGQQGSFYHCPSGLTTDAVAVILEHTGRVRISNKTADGKTISCN